MNNHFLPFLWVHGESEERYRQMIGVIQDANIQAFCVEARPHPNFCQEQWWQDMTIILDEAEKRGMKVWILDDKHFPTGYAAGAVENAPLRLRRRALTHRSRKVKAGQTVRFHTLKEAVPTERYGVLGTILMVVFANGFKTITEKIGPDELLSCVACSGNRRIDLMPYIKNGKLSWQVPEGDWTIEFVGLTYHSGYHRNYINMMDPESCRIQIDAVYEPHYAHFGDKFGTVIAGFFSDEPELGNGNYMKQYNVLGKEGALPYSTPLASRLETVMGPEWKQKIHLLWSNAYDPQETVKVRYQYMNEVTRLVEECFSKQIGDWCRERGVEYIGHVIEDNNQHARTSTSLGHYFRGLKWQSMAGIDDIGGQVMPGGENRWEKNLFGNMDDGEFYHFALGKLGSSLGILNPNMQGRTMCEIFGNYRWEEGVRLEKYLLDHFMVRGINYYVPHAFTCKDYPDGDCPPHFYAQGHNPQYRHFGELMAYGQRVCNLISGGKIHEEIAILYHGEAEWTGKCMMMQKPARILAENQVDFVFLPSDVFEERDFYRTQITDTLTVNGYAHKLVIVPYAQYLTKECAYGLAELLEKGGNVVFIDGYPDGIATGEPLPAKLKKAAVCSLDALLNTVQNLHLTDAVITPASRNIRVLHYHGAQELYFFVNEADHPYSGTVHLPGLEERVAYDPWQNEMYSPKHHANGTLKLYLEPHKSIVFLRADADLSELGTNKVRDSIENRIEKAHKKESLTQFDLFVCKSAEYPTFTPKGSIKKLEGYEKTDAKFSGYIRYQTEITRNDGEGMLLEITDAYEGVEVFMNGNSLGIQVTPRYLYDLTPYLQSGRNKLAIEVATTLERERGGRKCASGIVGQVNLYTK